MPIDNDLNPVLGIDLGTTFSAVARWDGRGPQIYQMQDGADTLQSVVFRSESGEFLVGKLAYARGGVFPENMVIGAKRLMDDGEQKVRLGAHETTPVELSAQILRRIHSDVAGKFPAGRFQSRGTVVTVPYYFKAHQCENTRRAATLAGIECLGILQEPIAASLSYAWQQVQQYPERTASENILVFDLGGGTFDLTLFRLAQSPQKLLFEVLATGGDDRLGGMDFDTALVELLLQKGNLSFAALSPQDELKARHKLLLAAIETKHTLSATKDNYVMVSDITPGQHLDVQITRADFEAAIAPYIHRIEQILQDLWTQASGVGVKAHQVDRVILVGGSSRIPRMRELLSDAVGADKIWNNSRPDHCVAEGAAMYAAYLDDKETFGREIEIRSRTCHALGIETAGGRFCKLIPPNKQTPCEVKQLFTTDTDDMTTLDINIYQGASPMVVQNTQIGVITVTGLPKRKAGELDITVTFKVNEEQMLSVAVEAEGMRKSASIQFA